MDNAVYMVTVYSVNSGPHTYSGAHEYVKKVREVAILNGTAVSGITKHVAKKR